MGLLVDSETGSQLFKEAAGAAKLGDSKGQSFVQDASPEEADLGMQMMANTQDLMSESPEAVLDYLANAPDIAAAAGEMAAEMIIAETSAMEMAGREAPHTILMDVGTRIIAEIFDLAVAGGVWQPQSDEEMEMTQREAMLYATDHWMSRMEQEGKITPEMQEGMNQLAEKFKQSDMTVEEFNAGGADGKELFG